MKLQEVILTTNASGAAQAAARGYLVMIVDVIDLSTSLEVAIEMGAKEVLGASPDKVNVPVPVCPEKIGKYAGRKAVEYDTEVIIVAEPRWGNNIARINSCKKVIYGIEQEGGKVQAIIPNLGAEVRKIVDFKNKIVVGVSNSGGVAFDAAWQHSKQVITGTIARTFFSKGNTLALNSAQRAIKLAAGKPIAVVAASSNSLEDILAAEFIYKLIFSNF